MVTLVLPDSSVLSSNATCKIMIRRIKNNNNRIDVKSYESLNQIFTNSNILVNTAEEMGTFGTVMLCQNYWYMNY
jgi:hypothetical protein